MLKAPPRRPVCTCKSVSVQQGAALVHIYKDGSVLVTHGGTEMGQGVHTKVQQVRNPAGFEASGLPGPFELLQQKTSCLRLPAGGESRAPRPPLQGLHQRNQHHHGSQHLPHRRVLRDRCQRHGGQGKVLLFLLLFIRCRYSVITALLVCSERLPDSVPAAGANQAEVPRGILGELGMDGVRLRPGDPGGDRSSSVFSDLSCSHGESQFVSHGVLQVGRTTGSSHRMLAPVVMLMVSVCRGPDLHMDWEKMEGDPFAYFTFGVCCSEVELDVLSGDYRVRTQPHPQLLGLLSQALPMSNPNPVCRP